MALGPQDVRRTQVHGATVLTLRDKSFPIVHFTLALRHGAITDPKGEEGALAALLPLLLRGTTSKSRAVFNAALEALGSTVDTAAGHEMAYISGTCLKKNFAATLTLVGEALADPALSEDELRPLCEETRQSLLSERDDDETVADLFMRRSYYGEHRLAQSATGTLQALSELRQASMQRAAKHLVAERFVVGVAGDVTEAEVQAAIEPLLAPLAKKSPEVPAIVQPQGRTKPLFVVVDKPDRTQVQLRLARPGVHVAHPDSYAFWLGIMAFAGTFTSPFTREVRDIRGWSYFAHADYRRRSLFTSPVVLRSAPALTDALDCLALEVDLFDRLGKGELAAEPLALARNYLVGRLPFQTATAFDLLGQAVSLEIMNLPPDDLWSVADKLEAIDLTQVGGVMARHLGGKAACAVLVGPKEALAEGVRTRFPDAEIQVLPYTLGLDAKDAASLGEDAIAGAGASL